MQTSRHQNVDLDRFAQRSGFGDKAGFNWQNLLIQAGENWIAALSDPLEGAEDAGEHQRVGLPLRNQRQADEQRRRLLVVAPLVVEMPAPLVVQATGQHVLHRHVEVLLV